MDACEQAMRAFEIKKGRIMREALVLLCLWVMLAAARATPATAPGVQVVLELSDGSRIVGTPATDRIKIVTQYSRMEIPLSLLRTIELSGTDHATHLSLRNGDLISGQLDASEISVKAMFGQVTIPINELQRIRVTDTGKAVPDGLVLHFSFDTDEGGRVTDMSGAGNDGKVIGATYTSEGKVGGAMSFSGDRQAVAVGNPASLQLQNFTIMAWVKRGSLDRASLINIDGANGHVFGYGQGGFAFAMHPNGGVYLCKVGFDEVQSPYVIHDESFHHVAVTKQGSRVVFYLDGVASPPSDYGGTFEFGTDAAVGAKVENMANSFIGVIDEVFIFNRGLSDDEVKGIYDSQK